MNILSGINLNLLTVLNALLKEQNVSKAAEKLNLTQPTVSNSLKQLREIFNDELLFRGPGNKMLLTNKAKEIKISVEEAVRKIENIFQKNKKFNPKTDSYKFKIAMSDYASIIYLPKIIQNINKYIGNITIDVKHLNNIWTFEDFTHTGIDLAIGNYAIENDIINKEPLFNSKIICAASKNHPASIKGKLSIEDIFKYQYISIFYKKEYWIEIDRIIYEKTGRHPKFAIKIPHMLVGLQLLENSNFICLLPNKMAEKYSALYNLSLLQPPIELPLSTYYLYWSKSDNSNTAVNWLKDIIKKIQI